ncbi:PLP-dependent aminotransferase family protein [Jeongeupia naejangsanensis]|uniref:Putative 8-amino-7-oxononanoate synthase n=1 Tax=Jeongeupia naejangsanensis TaxID=613195 RepID=A0ABS2BMK8_9NEIS|nr:PLP-dependent aminotransferase family protein [Jeongeupia naejangsanensis]MBM3116842.1 PLP-dependent aminotransferase family protein [Jeongeupia naejangsanensis]
MKRYEEIAELIAADIRNGRLAPGTRLPSIRKVMAQYRVSPSTAFQAYYLLEKSGLVRARERSGYFVAGARQPLPPEPGLGQPPQVSAPVDISELVFSVLGAVGDRSILPLGSAFPSPTLFPLPRLARSLASASRFIDPWDTVASLPPGHAALRQQIALRYLGLGMPQPAEQIVITNGALEALNLCLAAVAQPGDVIAIESPGFYAATQAIERLGMQALEIPVHARDGLDLDALASALERHPVKACWFMTSFQNPTGASMAEDKKKALVALLARHQIPLIEDDVYGELYFGKHAPLPAKAFDTQGLVMHCSSFSKTLAPGYRIGWVSPGRFGQRIERLKLMTTLSASVPAQVALADYLHTGAYDKHLRKLRYALESQLAEMNRALVAHFPAGVRVSRPNGGYFLWVEFAEGFDTLALHRRAIEHGISIAPGPIFSASRRYRHCLRLNYGSPWSAAFEQGMATLGRLAAGA